MLYYDSRLVCERVKKRLSLIPPVSQVLDFLTEQIDGIKKLMPLIGDLRNEAV